MQSWTLRNADLELTVFQEEEQRLTAELRLRRAAYVSPRVPLLALEIHDRMQERTDRVAAYRIMQCRVAEEQTLHVSVRDTFRGITVGLWLQMRPDGELSLLVPPAEVEGAQDHLYRLFALDLLPGLLSAGADGTVLLPINTGVLFSPALKPAVRDRFLIYGEQERWELLPLLPVCGVQTPAGGLVALATQGACDMYCGVASDGHGRAAVGLYPMFRRQWVDPVDWEQREVRIAALAPDADLAVAAGKRVRRHVVEDLGKPTLKQRAAESPACAYQQRAYTMKLFHGVQKQGIMMYGREGQGGDLFFQPAMTFAEAAANMRRLRDAGIGRILFQSVGWNPRGHDGAWPTSFPVERRLGGEEGLREMIAAARGLGYQITSHLNCNSAFFSSPDFVPERVLHDIWGAPKVVGFWGGGPKSLHWGLALPEGLIEARMEKLKSFGFNGMQYLDGMGNPLYLNYHPVHGGPRAHFAAGLNRYIAAARRVFGAAYVEMGFLYCAPLTDAFACGGRGYHLKNCRPEWPVSALLERRAPVWQLALHDLVTVQSPGLGWRDTIKGVLFGRILRDEWSAQPGVMPVLDDARLARLKARYDLGCEQFGHLVTEELVDWKNLGNDAQRTRYADGTEVVADLAGLNLFVNGQAVPRPVVLDS
jgi:hypothetical protein